MFHDATVGNSINIVIVRILIMEEDDVSTLFNFFQTTTYLDLIVYQKFSLIFSHQAYHISLLIRWSFFSFRNNHKNLDPSYKMDLDFFGLFRKRPRATRGVEIGGCFALVAGG